jgi:hypothetical protein
VPEPLLERPGAMAGNRERLRELLDPDGGRHAAIGVSTAVRSM